MQQTPQDVAFSYLRFSHPDQRKGDSIRRQGELRDAWLKRTGVELDTSLTLEDRGVSGYTGEHRDNPDRHALAAFLELVKQGRIPKGSYFIVENLDRLSREDIIPALSLLLNLIQAGVRVVQLVPVETVFDAKSSPMHLMMAIMELSRGHSESAMKSERVGGAWREKKRRAAAGGEALTARCPSWLRLVDGKWEVIEAAAAAVRQIYRWATDGHGIGVIVKKLNADGIPTIGAADYWARSYVAKILSNRAVVGEYQPYAGRAKKRHPDGEPIPNYYPALLTEQEWYAARAALANRRNKAGRLPKVGVNVFAGLLHDATGGGRLHQVDKGKKGGGKVLVPYRAALEGKPHASFPLAVFERAVLQMLTEIKPADVLPGGNAGADKVLALSGKLEEVRAQKERVKAKVAQNPDLDDLVDVLRRLGEREKGLAGQLTAAQQEAANPLMEAWGQCQTLADVLDKAPDPREVRVKLRAALRRICEGIWCVFCAGAEGPRTAGKRGKGTKPLGRGRARLAAVQLWFTGGARRDYMILHRPAQGGRVPAKAARSWVRSLAEVAPAKGSLDLRKVSHARRLEKVLATMDLPTEVESGTERPID
jgi:DNA invertase Pin-like site-specific DNA recombinase